jgi:hypothetical protein
LNRSRGKRLSQPRLGLKQAETSMVPARYVVVTRPPGAATGSIDAGSIDDGHWSGLAFCR